jgi:hypothetical protein
MRSGLPTVLLVGLLLSACGKANDPVVDGGLFPDPEDSGTEVPVIDGGGPPSDAGQLPVDAGFGPFGIERWCELYGLALCAKAHRCLLLDEQNVEACRARQAQQCQQDAYTAGVLAGRLQYLPAQAADCINGFAHLTCTSQTPQACAAVFAGLVAAEGACLLDAECHLGTFCHQTSQTCPHRCIAWQPPGQTCNWWDRACDPDQASCVNVDGANVCVARKDEGASCQYWSECRIDLACIDQRCVVRYAAAGQQCATTQGYPTCEEGYFCRLPLGAETGPGVCERKAALGGVCSGYGTCLPGLRCSSNYATGTCITLGGEGDVCSNYNDCRQELHCDVASSRCLALPALGESCRGTYRCRPAAFCDFQTYTCQAHRALDEPCSYDAACASGACAYGALPDGGNGYRCVASCAQRLDGGT